MKWKKDQVIKNPTVIKYRTKDSEKVPVTY